jgi:DNA-binding transcriptional MocR family regulator
VELVKIRLSSLLPKSVYIFHIYPWLRDCHVSRVLAADHDVARITVVEAYDRLVAEAFSRAGPARASSSPRPKSSPRSAWSRARPDVSGSACPSCAEAAAYDGLKSNITRGNPDNNHRESAFFTVD